MKYYSLLFYIICLLLSDSVDLCTVHHAIFTTVGVIVCEI